MFANRTRKPILVVRLVVVKGGVLSDSKAKLFLSSPSVRMIGLLLIGFVLIRVIGCTSNKD